MRSVNMDHKRTLERLKQPYKPTTRPSKNWRAPS
jgi:hypothetical protein